MSQTRWLERAVDALDVALLLIAEDRRVAYANAAAHRLYGLEPGLLQGLGVDRLIVPERRGELRNFEDVLSGGGGRKVRSVLRREDGARVDVTMVLEPCFDDQAHVSGVSVRFYEAPQHSVRPGLSGSKPPLGMDNVPGRTQPPPTPTTGPQIRSLMPEVGMPSVRVPADDPSRSSSRLSPARVPDAQRSRLTRVLRNLQWLEERLTVPVSLAPFDDPRERGRALLITGETLGLVEEAIGALDAETEIPPAPRIPKV
jgi:PAS domain S-box-containing protein